MQRGGSGRRSPARWPRNAPTPLPMPRGDREQQAHKLGLEERTAFADGGHASRWSRSRTRKGAKSRSADFEGETSRSRLGVTPLLQVLHLDRANNQQALRHHRNGRHCQRFGRGGEGMA